jgi:hypothetical protein
MHQTYSTYLDIYNAADSNCNDFDVIENNKQLNSNYQNFADIENPQIIVAV